MFIHFASCQEATPLTMEAKGGGGHREAQREEDKWQEEEEGCTGEKGRKGSCRKSGLIAVGNILKTHSEGFEKATPQDHNMFSGRR